jgi:predicted Zn-dependent protease
MEELLEKARNYAHRAEVYSEEGEILSSNFRNGQLHKIENSLSAGISLRMIKENKLGARKHRRPPS